MAKTALITGASSGIGAAFARALAARGYDVIVVARRIERLHELAAALKAQHPQVRVEVIPSDLSQPEAATDLRAAVEALGMPVDLLVNNAGLGIHGAFLDLTAADDEQMLTLNIVALTRVARAFAGSMRDRRSGAIINVASTAAFQPVPYFGVYAATKAYVLSFSEALSIELAPFGITVQALCPGQTESEFGQVAQFKTDKFAKTPIMTAEAVVAESIDALRGGAAVHIPGILNVITAFSNRFLPRAASARISGMVFKPDQPIARG